MKRYLLGFVCLACVTFATAGAAAGKIIQFGFLGDSSEKGGYIKIEGDESSHYFRSYYQNSDNYKESNGIGIYSYGPR